MKSENNFEAEVFDLDHIHVMHETGSQIYNSFFEQGPFGLTVLNQDFRIVSMNKQGQEWWVGHYHDAWHGEVVFDFFIDEDAIILKSLLNHIDVFRLPLDLQLTVKFVAESPLSFRTLIWKSHQVTNEFHYCLLFADPMTPQKKQDFSKETYKTIIDSQERERRIIGNLLHDSVAQLLYAIRLNLQHYMLDAVDGEKLLQSKELLNQAIEEVRDISKDLVPSVLNDFGLKAGLVDIAERLSMPGFQVSAHVEDECEAISFALKLALYRMTQELLNNAMKHSEASKVWVTLLRKKDHLLLVVEDNGRGFKNKVAISMKDGTGLRNIKSRLVHLKGHLRVKSNAQGTRINMTIPLH